MQKNSKPILLAATIGFLVIMYGCSVFLGEPPISAPPPPARGPSVSAPPPPGPPSWAPAHGQRAKHQYYYYPESSLYFDPARKLFFYLSGDGWRASVSLPIGIHIETSDYVALDMDTDEPFRFHSDVVKQYPPGKLKNLNKGKGKGK